MITVHLRKSLVRNSFKLEACAMVLFSLNTVLVGLIVALILSRLYRG